MIKTVLVFGYLILVMLVLFPIGVLAMLLYFAGIRRITSIVIYRLAQAWAVSLVKLTGCSITLKGKDNVPQNGGVCFVSNHCGYFDIILMLAYCGRPFGYIAKKELLLIPFINVWIFMLGGLFIDRKNVRKALKTINKGVQRLKTGSSMLIFPEGHRSKGRGLLPFHPGSLKLATMAEAVIVPVTISGSYDALEKNKRVVSSPVKVAFLEPIETANLPPQERKQILCDRIYSAIEKELANKNS